MKTAVILAGGLSQRMGYDKQLLVVDGKRLIVEQVKKLSEYFERIIIVTNNHILEDVNFSHSVEFISDIYMNMGPLGGIHAACSLVDERFYLIACDMPIINMAYIKYMDTFSETCVITLKDDWIEPFNAFYSGSLELSIKDFIEGGRRNIFNYLKGQEVKYIEESQARMFDEKWQMFKNINKVSQIK